MLKKLIDAVLVAIFIVLIVYIVAEVYDLLYILM